jgi:isovaleryl-CoA dehydrogenase
VSPRPSESAQRLPNAKDNPFELSGEQQEILDQADRFARNELYPLAERMDAEEWWPDEAFAKIGEAGLFGITVPEDYGGAGADLVTSGLVLQAFGRWNHALALSWVAHENLCLNNIYRNGSEAQRRKYLPDLCSGRTVGALGLTEPGAGSDALGSMRTTARRDGDHYVLNGAKLFITNGPVADVLLVYAKTAPEKGAKGISAFIVEKGTPGFSVAQKLEKMGYRGSPTGELVFDDCRVPAENLVGAENQGVSIVMSGLDLERAMISPLCLGVAERALELSIDYATTRKQFGQPIGSFQMVQSMLAEMYVSVETMRSFTYRTLAAAAPLEIGGGGRGEIHKLTAASVMYAAQAVHAVLDRAVQIHGGMGYIWESEINRLYRSTKLLEIGAGTTEVRKLIIAGELLKDPGSRG